MDKKEKSVVIGSAIASMYITHSNTCYVSDKSLLGFLNISPTIIGILLASVLTSLAIILAMIGYNEMVKIRELEKKKNKEFYISITENLKQDVYLILISLVISSFLSVFCIKNSYIIIPINDGISFEIYKSIFVVETALLVLSFIATYDIIKGMFNIFEFKYELANQNDK